MSKVIQAKIDKVAQERKYWRELSISLGAEGGSVVVKGFLNRISQTADKLCDDMDIVDPTNSIAVAKIQAGRALCKEILLDFNPDVCNKHINALDEQMIKLNAELKKALAKKKQALGVGFDQLIGGK